jgi:hypothetical protein
MKLTVFRSDKGDCLLVTSADGSRRMLVDGGMRTSYTPHVAPALGRVQRGGRDLDLVYVSHIDQDHIAGVLQLLDDLVAWRVHDYQRTHGNPRHPAPEAPRPPDVKAIWHNAFHETIGKNAGPIEDMLAAKAAIFSGAEFPRLREAIETQANLVASIGEAIRVSRRIGAEQLGIPLNPQFQGRLMLVTDNARALRLGPIRITIVGPFPEDLRKLRGEWNDWLEDNGEALARIRARAERDAGRLHASEVARVIDPLVQEALALGRFEGERLALAERLGRRGKVTTPNLASLMLLLEEGQTKVLLTGDGHWADILKGLERAGKLGAGGKLHVDVLKVQHHGSEHNIEAKFCDAVTADHYVFCGNGAHENPDLEVVELVVRRRLAGPDGRPFHLWFNGSSATSEKAKDAAHMREVEQLVAKLQRGARGRVAAMFLRRGSAFEVA